MSVPNGVSAHTPGPWMTSEHDANGQRIVRGEHIEVATCWHHSVGSIEKEMEANAALIAAAPDMLAALEQALADSDMPAVHGNAADYLFPWRIAARAAIAQARGQ
jgi:hypothetical protein